MKKLGPYLLVREIGVGGMGEVWKAQREGLDGAIKIVAIKMLLSTRADDPRLRRMFIDEARLSMQLNSSNIVQVFEADTAEDGTCYMAMEWIDGTDLALLAARMREAGETFPVHVATFIVGEVLKALAHAHEFEVDEQVRTIIHRDVSPHNVMVSVTGEVKLADFGIARLSSDKASGGHVKGKFRYMPPEQVIGDARRPAVDIFPVGAILHELLEGKSFRGHVYNPGHLYSVIRNGEVAPLSDPEGVPAEVRAVLEVLLAKQAEDRPSAREAYLRLSRWSGYRDAKFELADLVRELMRRPTISRDDITVSTTRETIEDQPVERTVVRAPSRWRSLAVIGGVLLLVLGAGTFGLGATLGWWIQTETSATEPMAALAKEPLEGSMPDPPRDPPKDPPRAPKQKVEALRDRAKESYEAANYAKAIDFYQAYLSSYELQHGEAPNDKVDVEGEIERLRALLQPEPSEKVPVTIAIDPSWTELEIGSSKYEIDRRIDSTKTLELEPGSVTIRHRDKAGGAWHSNTIEIPKRGPVELWVRSNGTIELVP